MSLDLTATALQIDQMAADLKARQNDRGSRLEKAVRIITSVDVAEYERQRVDSNSTIAWRVPSATEDPGASHEAPPAPTDFCVVAVDGSHIDVDRHIAARCFLVNIGVSRLTYGSSPDAELHSEPRLYAADHELTIRDQAAAFREQSIEGAILGAKRNVEEIRFLAQRVRDLPENLPTLALMDGSLIMMGLVGHGYDDYVLRELIDHGFVQALEELRQLAQQRPLAVASYISLPRSTEVANAMRLIVCPYEVSDCGRHCGTVPAAERPCEASVGGLMDRDVSWRTLAPGQRSATFVSSSTLVANHYAGHEVCFFYLHAGEEIGRVEVPSWVANNEASLALTHSLVYDQCRRGPGYPVALMEAHEQAVVTGADRQRFVQLVEEALVTQQMAYNPSEKSMSKRVRWL